MNSKPPYKACYLKFESRNTKFKTNSKFKYPEPAAFGIWKSWAVEGF